MAAAADVAYVSTPWTRVLSREETDCVAVAVPDVIARPAQARTTARRPAPRRVETRFRSFFKVLSLIG
jgi:hypothetical protein